MNITVGSPILQVALFVPEYVWARETTEADENAVDSNMDDFEGLFLCLFHKIHYYTFAQKFLTNIILI